MLVRELIEQLQDMPQDAEVKIAQQPQWPFEYSISEVFEQQRRDTMTRAVFDELSEDEQEEVMHKVDEDELMLLEDDDDDEPEACVYLAEGSQLGYLPGDVSRGLGWR